MNTRTFDHAKSLVVRTKNVMVKIQNYQTSKFGCATCFGVETKMIRAQIMKNMNIWSCQKISRPNKNEMFKKIQTIKQ